MDHPDIDALLQEMGGEAMPQCMNSDILVEARGASGAPAGALHGTRRDGTIKITAGKEPVGRASLPPITPQDDEQLLRQHHEAIFAALALPYVDDHAGAIDVVDRQCHGLRDTQAGGVDGDEDCSHPRIGDNLQQALDLLARKHCRQGILRAGEWDVFGHIQLAERRSV